MTMKFLGISKQMKLSIILRLVFAFIVLFFSPIFISSRVFAEDELPDLIIQSVTQRPDGKFDLVIKNIGPGAYTYTGGANKLIVRVNFNNLVGTRAPLGGIENTYSGDVALAPNQLFTWIVGMDPFSYGAERAEFLIDPANKIPESSEGIGFNALNNSKEVSLVMPDFVADDAFFTSDTSPSSVPVLQVKNIGSDNFAKSDETSATALKVKWEWKDGVGAIISSGLQSFSTLSFSFPGVSIPLRLTQAGTIPENAVTVVLTLNPDNVYQEYSKSNNSKGVFVPATIEGRSQGAADLVIDSIRYETSGPVYVIANIGGSPVVFPNSHNLLEYTLERIGDDGSISELSQNIRIDNPSNGGIIPGQRIEIRPTIVNPNTVIVVSGIIDPTGLVPESKGNNAKRFEVPGADLAVGEVRFNPDFSAVVEIKNLSSIPAGSNSRSSVTLQWLNEEGNPIFGKSNLILFSERLTGNNSYFDSIAASVVPQTAKKMVVTIEPRFPEGPKANNSVTVAIPPRLPDLALVSLSESGNDLVVEMQNVGGSAFSGAVTGKFTYTDLNQVAHSGEISFGDLLLAPYTNQVVQKIFPKPFGNSTVTFTLTLDSPVDEGSTSNNATSKEFVGTNTTPEELVAAAETTAITEIIASLDPAFSDQATNRENTVTPTVAQSEPTVSAPTTEPISPTPTLAALPEKKQEEVAGILPDSPFYVFKGLGRSIRSVFTFGSEKKIVLEEQYLKEKIIEANVLVEHGKEKEAANHVYVYEDSVNFIRKEAKKIRKKSKGNYEAVALATLIDQMEHKTILDKIEKNSPADKKGDVFRLKKKMLADTAELLESVPNEKIEKKITDKLAESKGSLKSLQDLEVVKTVQDNLSDDKKKGINHATKDAKKLLAGSIASVSKKNKKLIPGYLDAVSIDANTVKVLDDLKFSDTQKEIKAAVGLAQKQSVTTLAKKITSINKQNKEDAASFLADLDTGSFDDYRTLSQIEAETPKNERAEIAESKKKVLEKYKEKVLGLSAKDKKEFLANDIGTNVDIEKVKLLHDLPETLNTKDEKITIELENAADAAIEEQVEQKDVFAHDYDQFVNSFVGENVDDMKEIKNYVTIGGHQFEADIIAAQINYFEDYYKGVTDPEELAEIEHFIENNAEWRGLFEKYTEEDFLVNAESNVNQEENEQTVEEKRDNEDNSDQPEEKSDDADASESNDVPSTSGCKDIDDPVCGNDGYNYPNECEAHDNSTTVAYKGLCREDE